MPTYAYQCQECGHAFDAFQKFSDDPLTACPQCEGRIRRVIHPTPVVFKGSGWYITDSKAGANGKAEKADKADAKKEGAADAKTDKTEKTEKTAKGEAKPDKAAPAPVAASAD